MARTETMLDMLFASLAEQVKLPLTQIRFAAQSDNIDPGLIDATALAALRLIDGYLLSVELQQKNQLDFEPVSLGSLLYDTANDLREYAMLHRCDLEISVQGKYGPVMARQEVVKSLMLALGYSFIGAQSSSSKKRSKLVLAVRKNREGISAGVFGDGDALNKSLLEKARKLSGKAHQVLPEFTSENGAGILIADRLAGALDAEMRPTSMAGMNGLGLTLIPSKQLSLI